MPLSWNDIREGARKFSQEYKNVTRENAETQSFYNDFFSIFGIKRNRVASFEASVKMLGSQRGRMDLFWKGTLLVEHKSSGKDLDAAYTQTLGYFDHLKEEDLPHYILVSDFQRFKLYDLETNPVTEYEFPLSELHQHVELFGFIAGYQKRVFQDQAPVDIQASEQMGKLHDMLKDSGYTGHDLEQYLVRLLFCLFADDTTIFVKDSLRFYIDENTRADGSDLGSRLFDLFQTLNTPYEKRYKTLDESLAQFPYINGSLFEERLPSPAFNRKMRDILLRACAFNWGQISPAIFGSLFQSVMDLERRRGIGAHYTTEKNILKILKPLFLDGLYEEFETVRHEPRKLQNFHKKLQTLTFLDPACGCGNFLILTYRELRLLEIEVLKALHPTGQLAHDVSELSRINVDAFYGIELEEFPARIAEVALWLMEHQMNLRLSETFGLYYARIPLQASANIHHANALQLDWETVVPKERLSYILGNPPFVGKTYQSDEQKKDMGLVFGNLKSAGLLDYVSAWYLKAAQYLQSTRIVCAFVSTNSISQGEQVSILWQELFTRYHVKIHFAHRTFSWNSEARGKAAVHCVIIGFAAFDTAKKLLYDYDSSKSEAHETQVRNINPYLIEAEDFVIPKRNKAICEVQEMGYGSKPADGGFLILTDTEKTLLLSVEPQAEKWIRKYIGSDELIHNYYRWCLWLHNVKPEEFKAMPSVMERISKVKQMRLNSTDANTRRWANFPTIFQANRQPTSDYLAIPETSSENRAYIPIGFLNKEIIVSNSIYTVPNATVYHFGLLTSAMHMAWMRTVCGRLKSDFRYSVGLVYNNFPWPQNPTPQQVQAIETKAQAVLEARAQFPNSTLAQLYDPLTMPPVLSKAHQALDKAVDAAYRKQPFETERSRVEFLFGLYQQLTAPLITAMTKTSRKRKIN
ncbi:MAG: class I SAM-dependent DNA methyltransferase [Chloroflexi bacterium]|nr:class I SAM-dependent DNA methyltransferase [Chloroflexota bacterium]